MEKFYPKATTEKIAEPADMAIPIRTFEDAQPIPPFESPIVVGAIALATAAFDHELTAAAPPEIATEPVEDKVAA